MKIYNLLGKNLSEILTNSELAKWYWAAYGACAARKVGLTLPQIDLSPTPQPDEIKVSVLNAKGLNVWQLGLQGWADAPPMFSAARTLNEKANPQLKFHYLILMKPARWLG